MTTARFKDRYDAGQRLADALAQYRDSDPIVLGSAVAAPIYSSGAYGCALVSR